MFNIYFLLNIILSVLCLYAFVNKRLIIGKYLNILDKPRKNKIHINPTPLIGSYSIVIICFINLIYFNSDLDNDLDLIFFSSFIFFLLGYIDDRFDVNAYNKLLVSVIILFVVNSFTETFYLKHIYIATLNKHLVFDNFLSNLFTIFCILSLINALNLSDGINGLASGFAGIWLFSLGLISANEVKIFLLIISIFILINSFFIIEEKFFLGDSGSLFLGCFVSLSTIYVYNNLLINGKLIPVEKIFIFFMIPGIDMLRLFIIRLKNKRNPFSRDLDHLHHILLKLFKLKKTLLIYFLAFITTNYLSFFNIFKPTTIIFIYLLIYIFFILFFKKKFINSS